MKNLAIISLAILAIELTSSTTRRLTELCVVATAVTTANVTNPSTYSESCSIVCQTDVINQPCKLDLTKIPSSFGVIDRSSFLSYLSNPAFFPIPSARVAEVNRIAIEWKP